MKTENDYVWSIGRDAYTDIPKAVWAAIAFSLAGFGLHGKPDVALAAVIKEWETLHDCGIVPQVPIKIEA